MKDLNINLDETRELVVLFGQPRKVLSIMSSATTTQKTIGDYLNGNGVLTPVYDNDRFATWVAIVPENMAQFFVDRLASGLHGAKAHDTIDEAVEHIGDLLF